MKDASSLHLSVVSLPGRSPLDFGRGCWVWLGVPVCFNTSERHTCPSSSSLLDLSLQRRRRETKNGRGRKRERDLVESSLDVSVRVLLLVLETIATNSFRREILRFRSTHCSLLLQLRLQNPSYGGREGGETHSSQYMLPVYNTPEVVTGSLAPSHHSPLCWMERAPTSSQMPTSSDLCPSPEVLHPWRRGLGLPWFSPWQRSELYPGGESGPSEENSVSAPSPEQRRGRHYHSLPSPPSVLP